MAYAPQNPVDVPPFQLQRLIQDVVDSYSRHRFLLFQRFYFLHIG